MDRLRIKRRLNFLETYVIPVLEAVETLKPSAFAKGLGSIKKRKLELLDTESTSPGRECAYLFDLKKRLADG